MIDNSLKNIFRYFLYLGCTGFGGPLALIQQMRKDLAKNHEAEFDQAFTMIKAMPGPIAFQMAVYWGQRQGKFWGGFLAGVGMILPSFILMVFLAYNYEALIENKILNLAIHGAQYAVAGIILMGLYKLSFNYRNQIIFWMTAVTCALCFYFKWVPETILILGAGLIFVGRSQLFNFSFFALTLEDQQKLLPLFKESFKTGALVFGTGLAAFPFLQAAFVDHYGWLDLKTFNDAVSFGQMTPGPVTIANTFMGFKIAHFYGAFAATVGLFLPAFFHMSTWFPQALNWLSKQKWVDAFILGSTAAVVGCVFVTVLNMNRQDFSNIEFWSIFGICLLLQIKWKNISILKVILLGAVLEVAFSYLK